MYWCNVRNDVSITSLDAAQVDDISGSHKAGYNSQNVEGFSVTKGIIHFFPYDFIKFFENIKGIEIGGTGLKEIHQSELKDFPKLMYLHLYSNNLENLEENLFEFNPNLEFIDLSSNKISHIDPNVFDKLTKLKSLNLESNICINTKAENNQQEVQKVIKSAKSQIEVNLKQKVKNLEFESKNLNLENFKEKLEMK